MSESILDDLPLDGSGIEPPAVPGRPFEVWQTDWRLLGLPGVDQARWGGAARLDPVGTLFGFRAPEIEPGRVTFTMPWNDWLLASDGRPHPGMPAVLADAAHSAAVQTTLPPGHGLTTLTLAVEFLESPEPGAGLTCHAEVPDGAADGGPLLSTATIVDSSQRTLARTSARCSVFVIADPAPEPPEGESPRDVVFDPPYDPGAPVGEILPPEVWQTTPPLEILDRLATGAAPLPPIYHLIGLRPVKVRGREAVFTMPASPWLGSILMNTQGGLLALMAEATASAAVATTLDSGGSQTPLNLRIGYARGVESTGDPIVARAAVPHRGRTIASASCELLTPEGKACAFAASTHLV